MIHYSDTSSVRYFLLDNGVLSIKFQNFYGVAKLLLDPRAIYDFEKCSRTIFQLPKDTENIITFKCIANGNVLSEYYISIYCKMPIHLDANIQSEDFYSLEASRNSTPFQWCPSACLDIDFSGDGTLYITSGKSKELSESRLESILKDRCDQLHFTILNNEQHTCPKLNFSPIVNQAYQSAILSLESLKVDYDTKGIYTGLPWFFHWWSRDESISLGALIELKQYEFVKQILIKQSKNFMSDGRISCRYPKMQLASSDSTGWCATRLYQLIQAQPNLFSSHELKELFDIFSFNVNLLEQNYLQSGLISSNPWETWMDTGDDRDRRDGFLIEIQLLHQRIHDLIYLLSRHLSIKMVPVNRLNIVKDKFFDVVLRDRLDMSLQIDKIVRPNLFICYYIYHNLLSKSEWESCFDQLIDKLWLDWGGFASIEIGSELYQDTYTGETNESYHRGDSWYYLNNMAAICLKHLNFKKYKYFVEKILKASSNEIVFMGASGHHAEVSSAKHQESQGCLSQAWSAAMYIELFNCLKT